MRRWVVSGLTFGAVLPGLFLLWMGFVAFRGLSAVPKQSEMAVIFGTAVTAKGKPRPALQERLQEGLRLWRAGLVRTVMVSGAIESGNRRDEARIMADWLMVRGVPEAAIIVDSHGNNTWLTALHVARLHPQRAVVVTQWFHILRAEWALGRAGVSPVSGAAPSRFRLAELWYLFRDSVALPVYVLTKAPPG
ncbi:YdcF family protein [Gluconobacter sp. LMG 1744]|uniref:YdcF family protein n=1 Tax=Gluconobacter cadivus TaxID=2728101 RepID=A0ABR9YT12_9PROT|nr:MULTISPECIES: YdcF family protein [Gluconobacter]MBF0887316.1 YdcF family protein [Gluconobacter cadivus]MBF0890444.1 YdcF family protein [Gluconobacter cadivus]MBS1059385.1 YdcF family protein [Gluconobacter sp. Dm-44]